jgi:hypothetical protein
MSAAPEPAVPLRHGLLVAIAAIALAAGAAIAGGVTHKIVASQYGSAIALKDTTIAKQQTAIQTVDTTVSGLRAEITSLQSRLAAAESARATQQSTIQSLDTALNSLRADNADLRARLAAADAALARGQRPRDPNAIFQMGAEVGRVTGAREDRDAKTVTFDSIEGGNFDRGQEFEYRDLTLRVTSHKSALTSFTGRGVRTELTGVQTTIVGTRPPP